MLTELQKWMWKSVPSWSVTLPVRAPLARCKRIPVERLPHELSIPREPLVEVPAQKNQHSETNRVDPNRILIDLPR